VSALSRNRPPGRLISVDGGQVHIVEAGVGSPTVVFESGMGGNVLDWTRVMAALPDSIHRLAYDRAGLGWSEARSGPRSPDRIADELGAVLRAAGTEPPYIFVAHSMGSRYVRLFAERYPDAVVGLVLVDGFHETWDVAVGPEALASFINARIQFWRLGALLGRLGIVRLLGPRTVSLLGPDFRDMPRAERARYAALLAESPALHVASEELRHGGDSNDVLGGALLGDLPLVVIAHGVPFRDSTQEQAWQDSQVEMTARSSQGRLVRAARSAHSVMIAEPDVVVDAIEELIDK
jgi:pimeloyl-ACP methyl ester carboxylesterase